jgi:hypothetical protein
MFHSFVHKVNRDPIWGKNGNEQKDNAKLQKNRITINFIMPSPNIILQLSPLLLRPSFSFA